MMFSNKIDAYLTSHMINTDDVASSVDLEELEKQIISGNSHVSKEELEKNPVQMHENIINEIMNDESSNVNNTLSFNDNVTEHSQNDNMSSFNDDILLQNDNISSFDDNVLSFDDKNYPQQTMEEQRSKALRNMMSENEEMDDDFDITPERLEDNKSLMIEEIESLKNELYLENVKIDDRFNVTEHDSYEKIQDVWRKLKIKSQYKMYNTMFEDSVMLFAKGVEWTFDGKDGGINMTGWPDALRPKLRKMRLETASFISDIMQEYRMSPGITIISQILMSGILWSVTNRKTTEENKKTISDREWKEASHKMEE